MTAALPSAERRSSETRRAQVITAARDLFLSKGFEQTSIKDITDVVGGSRRDIYGMFTDKEGLFDAVLQSLIAQIVSPAEMTFPARPGADIGQDLRAFGTGLLANMLDPATITIFRQFVSIGAARPEIGRQAYLSGPGVLYVRLADYLSACAHEGRLRIDDADRTARIFIEMLKGDYQLRALMTNETSFDRADLEAHVKEVVALFLNGARQG
jgi:AcrR family transcriptional regulator